MRYALIKLIFLILIVPVVGFAQDPAKWSLTVATGTEGSKAGSVVGGLLRADVEDGWHLYALDQPEGGPIPTTIKVSDGSSVAIVGLIKAGSPLKVQVDQNFVVNGRPLETKYFEHLAMFNLDLKMLRSGAFDEIRLDVRYQLCNDTFCLPPRTKRVSLAGEEDVKKPVTSTQSPVSSQTTNNELRTINSLYILIDHSVTRKLRSECRDRILHAADPIIRNAGIA